MAVNTQPLPRDHHASLPQCQWQATQFPRDQQLEGAVVLPDDDRVEAPVRIGHHGDQRCRRRAAGGLQIGRLFNAANSPVVPLNHGLVVRWPGASTRTCRPWTA